MLDAMSSPYPQSPVQAMHPNDGFLMCNRETAEGLREIPRVARFTRTRFETQSLAATPVRNVVGVAVCHDTPLEPDNIPLEPGLSSLCRRARLQHTSKHARAFMLGVTIFVQTLKEAD